MLHPQGHSQRLPAVARHQARIPTVSHRCCQLQPGTRQGRAAGQRPWHSAANGSHWRLGFHLLCCNSVSYMEFRVKRNYQQDERLEWHLRIDWFCLEPIRGHFNARSLNSPGGWSNSLRALDRRVRITLSTQVMSTFTKWEIASCFSAGNTRLTPHWADHTRVKCGSVSWTPGICAPVCDTLPQLCLCRPSLTVEVRQPLSDDGFVNKEVNPSRITGERVQHPGAQLLWA